MNVSCLTQVDTTLPQSPTIDFDFADLGDCFAPISARLPRFVGDEKNEMVVRFYDNLHQLSNQMNGSAVAFDRLFPTLSPIVLHGPGYSGKSCLAAAIAKRLIHLFGDRLKSTRIHRIGLADFCRDYGKSVHAQSVEDFLAQFNDAGVIQFDDLQNMGGNLHASLELEKLLDRMETNRQIAILTSRKPLRSIPQLVERLASRFSAGVVLPVQLPGPTGKKEIIRLLRDLYQADLNRDTIDSICASQTVSFADITQHYCSAQVTARDRNENSATEIPLAAPKKHQNEIADQIIHWVADYFDQPVDELIGSSRRKKTSLARNICVFAIRNKTGMSYQKIGRRFSNRDHSTIMHAYQKISANQKDLDVRNAIEMIDDQIYRNQKTPMQMTHS